MAPVAEQPTPIQDFKKGGCRAASPKLPAFPKNTNTEVMEPEPELRPYRSPQAPPQMPQPISSKTCPSTRPQSSFALQQREARSALRSQSKVEALKELIDSSSCSEDDFLGDEATLETVCIPQTQGSCSLKRMQLLSVHGHASSTPDLLKPLNANYMPSERTLFARGKFCETVNKIKQLEQEKRRVEELNNYNEKATELQTKIQEVRQLCSKRIVHRNEELQQEVEALQYELEERKKREEVLQWDKILLNAKVQDLQRRFDDSQEIVHQKSQEITRPREEFCGIDGLCVVS